MSVKQKQSSIFTSSINLDQIKEGTEDKAKNISANVLKQYIDYVFETQKPTQFFDVNSPPALEEEEDEF